MNRVAVVGAGAWGTALALQAHRGGAAVSLWSRTAFAGESPHLPGFPIPAGVRLVSGFDEDVDVTVLAVPVQHLRAVAGRLRPRSALVAVCKGVETGTGRLPLEVLAELHPGAALAVLSGPNFAHEVAAGLPTASVVACADPALRGALLRLLGGGTFRLYGNDDVVGVQVGGAAKNVVAIAAGAVTGAGLGENARAALITRGIAELARLAVRLGGRAETVSGLSGLGDLLLTCTGASSRNFRCGLGLGQGLGLNQVVREAGGVIEGIATAPALVGRAAGLELPVCEAVAGLLAGRVTLDEAIAALMARPMRDE